MTNEEFTTYQNAANSGSVEDRNNPIFTFSLTDSSLLALILSEKFNVEAMMRRELANRGLNEKGEWIGFHQAEVYFQHWMANQQ